MTWIQNTGGRLVELPLPRALKRVKDGDAQFYEGPHPTDARSPDIEAPKLPVKKFQLSARMRAVRDQREKERKAAEDRMSKKEKTANEKAKAEIDSSVGKEQEKSDKLLNLDPKELTIDQCKEILDRFGKVYGEKDTEAGLQSRVAAIQNEL